MLVQNISVLLAALYWMSLPEQKDHDDRLAITGSLQTVPEHLGGRHTYADRSPRDSEGLECESGMCGLKQWYCKKTPALHLSCFEMCCSVPFLNYLKQLCKMLNRRTNCEFELRKRNWKNCNNTHVICEYYPTKIILLWMYVLMDSLSHFTAMHSG